MHSLDLPLSPISVCEREQDSGKLDFKSGFQLCLFCLGNHQCTWNHGQNEFVFGTRAEIASSKVYLSGTGTTNIRCVGSSRDSLIHRGVKGTCVMRQDESPDLPPSPFLQLPPPNILLYTKDMGGCIHIHTITYSSAALRNLNNSHSLILVGRECLEKLPRASWFTAKLITRWL